MNTPTHQREEALFQQAMERTSPAEREAFLVNACGADEALLAKVRDLLACDAEAADEEFLPTVVTGADRRAEQARVESEQPGERIGRYKLLQEIGEGGFGTVWMAEQVEPLSRRVALKIIKLGMDTREVIARFEAERQALAMMDHPNIARVLDAGATDKGRPFFVMELVKGVTITKYCDEAGLNTRERLALFGDVCSAINHAHQKGIIHRDIKPSNVMVTMHGDKAVVKVIDFGIAKATQGKLTDKTLFTRFEQMIGTPVYMSPEQASLSGLDIDTRSDIYALGILLYELLVGKPPFDGKSLASAGYEEMRRIIREVEPPKPSSRLSTVAGEERTLLAKARHIEPEKLHRLIEPDLDCIVMKAIEKDRTRRYETANGLAMDIERHLGNEPIVARPPSTTYRLQKMMRRNKLAFAAAAAVFAALVMGMSIATWMYFKQRAAYQQASAAKQRALTEAARSEQVAQFLRDMLKGVGPSVAKGQDTRMLREILDRTAQRIDTDLNGQPDVEATLRFAIGDVYLELSEYALAERTLRPNLDLMRNSTRFAAHAAYKLASALRGLNRLDEAEQLYRQALEGHRKLDGNDGSLVSNAIEALGAVYQNQGRLREAETNFLEALAIEKRRPDYVETDSAWLLLNLGKVVSFLGRNSESEALHRRTLPLVIKRSGRESLDTADAMHSLAVVISADGKRLAEAETLHREALGIERKLLGEAHREVSKSTDLLASSLENQSRLAEAEALYRDLLARQRTLVGDKHLAVADTLSCLGAFLRARGRFTEAEVVQKEALATYLDLLGQDHLTVAEALNDLGITYYKQERHTNAEPLLRQAVGINRSLGQYQETRLASHLLNLGNVLRGQNKWEEAAAAYRESLELRRKWHGEPHAEVAFALNSLGNLHTERRNDPEAEAMFTQALEMSRRLDNQDQVASSLQGLAALAAAQRNFAKAEALHREALPIQSIRKGKTHPDLIWNLDSLGWVIEHQGRLAEAEWFYREALAIADRQTNAAVRTMTRRARQNLFDLLTRQRRWADAEPVAHDAVKLARDVPSSSPSELEDRLSDLARVRYRQGNFAEAESAYLERLASLSQHHSTTNDKVVKTRASLGRCLADWALAERGQSAALARAREGERLLRECLVLREGSTNSDRGELGDTASRLAGAMFAVVLCDSALTAEARVSRLGEIEALLLSGQDQMAKSSQSDPEHRRDGLARLLLLYETWSDLAPNAGKSSQAAEWKQKLAAFEQGQAAKKEPSPERAELEEFKAKSLPTAVATLFPPDSEWKWLHPTDGVDPVEKDADFHTTFFAADFDDSGWKTGKDSADPGGGFGYGRDFAGVDLGTPEDKTHRHSAYFRHRFTTDKAHTSLELRCQRDDALIVYLDGKEVLRDNLPAGPDAYQLFAIQTQGPENDGVIHRFPLPGTLAPGEHILAISVHNAKAPSSDLRLGGVTLVVAEPEAEQPQGKPDRERPPAAESPTAAPANTDVKSLEEALDTARTAKGPEAPDTIAAMTQLAAAHGADGSGRKALKLGEEALALARRTRPAGDPLIREAMTTLIPLYRLVDLEEEAAKMEAELKALRRNP